MHSRAHYKHFFVLVQIIQRQNEANVTLHEEHFILLLLCIVIFIGIFNAELLNDLVIFNTAATSKVAIW